MIIKLFCNIFVFFDFDFYGPIWHHKCVWSWIWFPRHHELQFFFKCLDEFLSTQSALYGCFKSFLSNVDFFAWSSIWLPSYHKLHIWLGYGGCQERFMVVNPGVLLFKKMVFSLNNGQKRRSLKF